MDRYIQELKDSLTTAISNSIKEENKIGIFFSGGLDSSLLAHIVKLLNEDLDITLYTVGTKDSHDFLNTENAAELLDLNLEKVEVNSQDIISAIPPLAKIIGSTHPVTISFQMPLYLGLSKIKEKYILSGQGADELFGGYARYLNMSQDELKYALKEDVKILLNKNIKMDYKVAQHFKSILRTPYLHDDVVNCATKIPVKYKVNNGMRKIVLMKTAIDFGLPMELAKREKKAAQYSTGIIKSLRKTAKLEKITVNELIERLLKGI
jgi:asparagine synthase (glutamine-hydrolysing)